jgi:hypothetical protein
MSAVAVTKPLTAEANGVELAEYLTITEDELQEEFNLARYGNRYGKPGRNWEEDLKKVEEIRSRICLK